jgi:uncharacterized protein (TIGR02145 family)
MKIPLLLTLLLLSTSLTLHAQVGINADGSQPDPRAMLDVKSTSKGVLLPRLTDAERNALYHDIPDGMLIINTTTNELQIFFGSKWYPLTMGTGIDAPDLLDIEGNTYKVVTIGTQVWMAENLRTAKYNDNTDIPLVEASASWNSSLTTPAHCWYNNDKATYGSTYGAIYNWYAVETGKLCPSGWHVPTDTEFTALINYLTANGFSGTEGIALKSTSGWNSGGNGTDDFGFNALASGRRYYGDGSYLNQGDRCYWWTSTAKEGTPGASWFWIIQYNTTLSRGDNWNQEGHSVRCIKDE